MFLLMIILIGAALRHVRPEPAAECLLTTDPGAVPPEHWRCKSGQPVFWGR